jgi:predicted aconitase
MHDVKMKLTDEENAILDGSQGAAMAKVMKTIVTYGETFGAARLVAVTGEGGHLVTSFGLSVMKPVYRLLDELIAQGVRSAQPFTVDPRPIDHKNVPSNILQRLVFSIMYGRQRAYEAQLEKLGLRSKKSFTCTCYMKEVGNTPRKGDILSWAESSAVVYANSVLGARTNRNSGIIELFGSILGKVPSFGLLTDEGRRAKWIIDVRTSGIPEAQILGSAIGMKVLEDVPFVRGMTRFLGTTLDDVAKDYLKDFGAAAASNGSVGLFHIEGLTPEAVESGETMIAKDAITYVIDDAELARVRAGYSCIWKNPDARPKLCFIGCPHLSTAQLESWTNRIGARLTMNGRRKVNIPTVLTAAPEVLEAFGKTPAAKKLRTFGVRTSFICPLMYMNNPLCRNKPVITNSNKLRTYTSARYHTDEEILDHICAGGGK